MCYAKPKARQSYNAHNLSVSHRPYATMRRDDRRKSGLEYLGYLRLYQQRFPLKAPPACVVPPVVLPTASLPPVVDLRIHPSRGLDAFDKANQACSVAYLYGRNQYLALAAQPTKPTFDPRSLDLPSIGALVGFYHACLGFPVKWPDAAKAGNCDSFDGLTYSNIARYCPDSMKPSWVIWPNNVRMSAQCPHVHRVQIPACQARSSNPPCRNWLRMNSLPECLVPKQTLH
jgi:hypothetical protein